MLKGGENRMNKRLLKLGAVITTFVFILIAGVLVTQNVFATNNPHYGEWSECVANEGNDCGENGGTRSREVTTTTYVCPEGFTTLVGNTCKKVLNHYPYILFAQKVAHEEVTTETEDCQIPDEEVIKCEEPPKEECPPGWHEVPQEEVNEDVPTKLDILTDTPQEQELVCEEDPKEPEQPSNPPTFAGSSTEAPVCPDGNTVNVPANPHVLRAGEKATVNFFITEGDSADVVYKEVNASDWQHAVSNVKPNADKFVSVEISGLDPQLGYTFGVRQRIGCGGGQTITAVIIDGPEPTLFQFSYWEVK